MARGSLKSPAGRRVDEHRTRQPRVRAQAAVSNPSKLQKLKKKAAAARLNYEEAVVTRRSRIIVQRPELMKVVEGQGRGQSRGGHVSRGPKRELKTCGS